jgi:3-oxoacyl-[acyl-carrier protein] reductase
LDDLLALKGRVALVTGGSRGIGRAIADLLATLGVNISINYLQDHASAASAVSFAESKGVRAVAIAADVSSVEQAQTLVRETLKHFDRLDFLICNAGVWSGGEIELISEDLWDQTLDINLKGTWTVCRSAVPVMKKQGFGRIVIISSTAGQRGEANWSNYAASKGGQISFAKSLSSELAPFGINVNCIAPGWVDTDMTSDTLVDPERMQQVIATIPVGRVASPEEIAGPTAFLCSRWANHITGEILNVNGGSVLCG